MKIPVRSRSLDQLQALTTPAQGQLEAVRWVYYDTQTITSGTTTTLNFFNAVQSDKTLGNIEMASQIQQPNFFELFAIKCDILEAPTTNATATFGVMNDAAQILFAQRAFYEFTINSKSYGKTPLTYAHCSGGPVGLIQGTPATNAMVSAGNNSIPDDGDWIGGMWLNPETGVNEECGGIILPPTQSFALSVTMAAAPTLTGNIPIRMSLIGTLHRQVR